MQLNYLIRHGPCALVTGPCWTSTVKPAYLLTTEDRPSSYQHRLRSVGPAAPKYGGRGAEILEVPATRQPPAGLRPVVPLLSIMGTYSIL